VSELGQADSGGPFCVSEQWGCPRTQSTLFGIGLVQLGWRHLHDVHTTAVYCDWAVDRPAVVRVQLSKRKYEAFSPAEVAGWASGSWARRR
jgi:hypothetical protein